MSGRMAKLPVIPGTDIYVPIDVADEAQALLVSLARAERRPGEAHVRRMVDLGAGLGVFAAFAALRWPYAWLDCYEDRPEYAKPLRLNAQAGTCFFNEVPRVVPACEALHVGSHINGIEFDGPALGALRVCVWDFADDETFECAAGLMRAIGMRLAHVAMLDAGPPVRGWQLWIRQSAAPKFEFDLTPERARRK